MTLVKFITFLGFLKWVSVARFSLSLILFSCLLVDVEFGGQDEESVYGDQLDLFF